MQIPMSIVNLSRLFSNIFGEFFETKLHIENIDCLWKLHIGWKTSLPYNFEISGVYSIFTKPMTINTFYPF